MSVDFWKFVWRCRKPMTEAAPEYSHGYRIIRKHAGPVKTVALGHKTGTLFPYVTLEQTSDGYDFPGYHVDFRSAWLEFAHRAAERTERGWEL